MRVCSYRSRSLLAGTIVVFLLAFSFNAYACLVPLSGTSDASMANGCSTPIEQPARQLCDAFKTLGVESGSQSSSLLLDHHHLLADHALAATPAVSQQFQRIFHRYQPLESSSPPHQSLATTVLRI
ncbi:MAG: hypothetical protein KAX87_00555 [Nitrospira sp.]|nr:hypothetical protein [Nitrospira sp.]